jgi:hypothetical protein
VSGVASGSIAAQPADSPRHKSLTALEQRAAEAERLRGAEQRRRSLIDSPRSAAADSPDAPLTGMAELRRRKSIEAAIERAEEAGVDVSTPPVTPPVTTTHGTRPAFDATPAEIVAPDDDEDAGAAEAARGASAWRAAGPAAAAEEEVPSPSTPVSPRKSVQALRKGLVGQIARRHESTASTASAQEFAHPQTAPSTPRGTKDAPGVVYGADFQQSGGGRTWSKRAVAPPSMSQWRPQLSQWKKPEPVAPSPASPALASPRRTRGVTFDGGPPPGASPGRDRSRSRKSLTRLSMALMPGRASASQDPSEPSEDQRPGSPTDAMSGEPSPGRRRSVLGDENSEQLTADL